MAFLGASKTKTRAGKKIENSRNAMLLKDADHHVVSGPQKFSWVHGDALKSQLFKVFWLRKF